MSSCQTFRGKNLGTIEPNRHRIVSLNVKCVVVCNWRPNHSSPSHSKVIRWKTFHRGVQVPVHIHLCIHTLPFSPISNPLRIWKVFAQQPALSCQFHVGHISPTARTQKADIVAAVAFACHITIDNMASTVQTLRGHCGCRYRCTVPLKLKSVTFGPLTQLPALNFLIFYFNVIKTIDSAQENSTSFRARRNAAPRIND